MLRISFCGYDGKMGSKVLKFLQENAVLFEFVLINDKTQNVYQKLLLSNLVLDFTIKDFSFEVAKFCAHHKIPFISGTTGFSDNELIYLDELFKSNQTGCYICPNFSKGINILHDILPHISSYYKDVYIEETHNISKVDAPSGTSLQIKNILNKDAKISSKRRKHYNAIHKILFKDEYEEFIIIHKVKNKFAYGELVLNAINSVNSFIGVRNKIF